jgi:GTPase SAR1 family protein
MEAFEKTVFYYKIAIFGDKGVGKSTMIKTLGDNLFESKETNDQTIEINTTKILIKYNDKEIGLLIYEIDLCENFSDLYKHIFTDCRIIFLMFDICNIDTLNKIKRIYSDFPRLPIIPTILIGNKSDGERQVELNDIKSFVLERRVEYIEISSKTRHNIKVIMDKISHILEDVVERISDIRRFDKKNALFANSVFKIILLGDSSVGKSSFYSRYFGEKFDYNLMSTVGN